MTAETANGAMDVQNPAAERLPMLLILFPVFLIPFCVILWVMLYGGRAERAYERAMNAILTDRYQEAVAELEAADQAGHPQAAYQLYLIYRDGIDRAGMQVACDGSRAAGYLQTAADRGIPAAELDLAKELLARSAESASGIPAEAVERLRRAAEHNLPEALTLLGGLYRQGCGVPQSAPLAANCFERAAALEDPEAQCSLGEMYASGELGKPEPEKARKLLEQAAIRNVVRAYGELGALYRSGALDGKPDLGMAQIYFLTAIDHDDPAAMFNYAEAIWNGEYPDQPRELALELCKRAARLGLPTAQSHLGLLCYAGKLTGTPDYEAARKYFEAAAAGGDGAAWFNLGMMAELGQGGGADPERARRCYGEAAARGQKDAQLWLKNHPQEP